MCADVATCAPEAGVVLVGWASAWGIDFIPLNRVEQLSQQSVSTKSCSSKTTKYRLYRVYTLSSLYRAQRGRPRGDASPPGSRSSLLHANDLRRPGAGRWTLLRTLRGLALSLGAHSSTSRRRQASASTSATRSEPVRGPSCCTRAGTSVCRGMESEAVAAVGVTLAHRPAQARSASAATRCRHAGTAWW